MTYEKKISPICGTFLTLQAAAMGGASLDRTDALRDEFDNIVVDTCCAFDTGTWETGISKNSGEDWKIVEQFPSQEDALKGHKNWVDTMKQNPDIELKDVGVWVGMEDK